MIDTDSWKVTKTVDVGRRPRGIIMNPDGKELYICASDDDIIQVFDPKTMQQLRTLPSGPDPETFTISPDGKTLYVSNEDDNMVTMIDIAANKQLAQVPVGVEPEGEGISPDGKTLVNTSETTNMASFIDTASQKIVANVLVDSRPRIAMFSPSGDRLWVSSEVGGTVAVIDVKTHQILHKMDFSIPGVNKDAIQPVGIRITPDGKTAFIALGPANHVAVVDAATFKVREISAGGAARVADGIHARSEVSADHQRRDQRHLGDRRGRAEGHAFGPGRRLSLGRCGIAPALMVPTCR